MLAINYRRDLFWRLKLIRHLRRFLVNLRYQCFFKILKLNSYEYCGCKGLYFDNRSICNARHTAFLLRSIRNTSFSTLSFCSCILILCRSTDGTTAFICFSLAAHYCQQYLCSQHSHSALDHMQVRSSGNHNSKGSNHFCDSCT